MILLPNKKYNIIYADPPWHFKSRSEKGDGRNATQHYDCMSLKDICNMPVKEIADKDCVLLMWVTDPLLEKAFKVIDAWGFTYKTVGFTWAKSNKTNMGMFTGLGYWTRCNPEMCLLATKGPARHQIFATRQRLDRAQTKPPHHLQVPQLYQKPLQSRHPE